MIDLEVCSLLLLASMDSLEGQVLDAIKSTLKDIEAVLDDGVLGGKGRALPPLQLIHRQRSCIYDTSLCRFSLSPIPLFKLVYPCGRDMKFFVMYIRILEICLGLIMNNRYATKRDIFYQDVNLFQRQAIVDELIEDIACTFNVSRDILHIDAGSKGLICGDIQFICNFISSKQETSVISLHNEAQLIPPARCISDIVLSDPSEIIIVVEKEATFHWLKQDLEYLRSVFGSIVLVTGKGYPCLATRQLLFAIATKYPAAHIFGIFDYDPHGMEIYCTYKFGSKQLPHESDTTIVSRMTRIGINIQQFEQYAPLLPDRGQQHIIPLSIADKKKGIQLSTLLAQMNQHSLCQEIYNMLLQDTKLEIQSMQSPSLSILSKKIIPDAILSHLKNQ
jgi:meiotic recombination protein SPO11